MTDEQDETPGGPFDLEAPVWWDPKARDVIMKPRSFEPSLLVLHGPMVVLATDAEVVLSGELDRVSVSFPTKFEIPACDIRHGGDVFRFYFCMPHPKVHEFDPDVVGGITGVLADDGWGGPPELAGVSVPRMMAHTTLHVGKKRMERLQQLLG